MSGKSLRIAVTADPELPVPPREYGGIERVVAMLVDGLVARGHDVTLFAHRDSAVSCSLVAYDGTDSGSIGGTVRNMSLIASTLRRRPVDVIHSFGRLAYLLPLLPRKVPKLMSYQRAVTPRSTWLGGALARGSLHFTACSRRMVEHLPASGSWEVVYNGVRVEQYTFRPHVDAGAPLVFLGRIEHIKGAHVAIEVARRSGRRLVMAGNVPPEHGEYFRHQIQPHLGRDGISYAGPVDDRQKDDLLGGAAALLMPILWEEPFGIVMAEALACGTPVLAFARGAVPEVIDDGATGFVCRTTDDIVSAVPRITTLNRARCRAAAEVRFSQAAVVDAYERLYRRVIRGHRGRLTMGESA